MTMPTRAQVEDLLFHEADLLDSWKLQEWLALYTPDAQYEVPSTDLGKTPDPTVSLFYIADDYMRLEQRVIRLGKKAMHSEYPRSKTRHLVSNVRVLGEVDGHVKAIAGFAVYRSKNGHTDCFVGGYEYLLKQTPDGLRIRKKRCLLDLDGLRPQGRVSILL